MLAAGALALGVVLSGCEISRTFVVTTTADVVDAVPGDGVCDDGSGACSLRGAIQEANALPGNTLVQLAAGESYVLGIPGVEEDAGASGDLDVTGSVLLAGRGATVDGAGLDRVFDVHAGGSLVASKVTVTGGLVDVVVPEPVAGELTADGQSLEGPAAHEDYYTFFGGGGIRSEGGLVLGGVSVTGNEVSVAGPYAAGQGGGIRAETARIVNSDISGNVVAGTAATEAVGLGGGLSVGASATVADSTITGNSAAGYSAGGGGIAASALDDHPPVTLDVSGSTVSGNTLAADGASAVGGGVWVDQGSISGSVISGNDAGSEPFHLTGGAFIGGNLSMTDTTVEGNHAGGAAGVMAYFGYQTAPSQVSLERVNVVGNVAAAQGGGGISVISAGDPDLVTATIVDSTIASNEATDGAGILASLSPSVVVERSTISGNTARDDLSTYTNHGRGGGARLLDSSVSLTEVTLTDNTAEKDTGGVLVDDSQLNLARSFIGDQRSGVDCALDGYPGGTIASLGHNADSDGTCGLTEPTDLPVVVPLLGSLADNGGPTWTHLPLVGSPLLDVIPLGVNGCGTTPDQRGVLRPQGPACDIGSTER